MNWAALIPIVMGMMNQGGNSKTVTQQPLRTEEQKAIDELMANFAKTGKYGKYTAGESYNGELGDYAKSDMEATGQNKLMSLLNSGMGDTFDMGANEIKTLLSKDSMYDPSKSGIYDSFKKEARKNQTESMGTLDRTMAATGNFYSGARNDQQRRLVENTNDQLTSKLASLYDTYAQRRIGAIPMAMQAGKQEEDTAMGRIGAGMKVGGLDRMLNNNLLQDRYKEWMRSREDMLTPLRTVSGMGGSNASWGTPSMTVDGPNPWQKVFDTGIEAFFKNWNMDGKKEGTA